MVPINPNEAPEGMLNPLEQWKFKRFQQLYGEMTADLALDLAIQSEDFCTACGPFDIAYKKLKQDQLNFEQYALLIERSHQTKVTT